MKIASFDIGGTGIKYAVADQSGRLSRRGSFKSGFDMSGEELLSGLFTALDSMGETDGIGISTLGFVDSSRGALAGGADNLPCLLAVDFPAELHRRTGLPVRLLNDASSAAYGEALFGAGVGRSSFFMLTLGTGIGGCFYSGGTTLSGAHFRAGEPGLLYCESGVYTELNCSASAFLAKASLRLGREVDGVEFFRLCDERLFEAEALLNGWAEQLARIIADVAVLFDPECFLLGGGVSARSDLLIPAVMRALPGRIHPDYLDELSIVPALLKNDAGLLGNLHSFL